MSKSMKAVLITFYVLATSSLVFGLVVALADK